MSLISCDHQITLSPRRDVARKRLRPRRNYTKHSCFLHIIIVILQQLQFIEYGNALIDDAIIFDGNSSLNGGDSSGSIPDGSSSSSSGTVVGSSSIGGGGHYLDKLDKLDKLERSVAAVLIKVAYGTTSTTKRSIPDNSYVPSLTTIATPPLTTFRYLEKTQHQQIINLHHRNYELDLERDHALPTSAPNADILKSNSNPTYPNPNRHHNHDRDRHRHLLNSTPAPSMHNLLKKGQPTIPMYPGDMPSYSPPARSFFTPPLPPEYQNPFADKPTLRGTNNDAGVVNTGTYINRRPIPPPSLMPGHERIPFRPPDLNSSSGIGGGGGGGVGGGAGPGGGIIEPNNNNNRRVNNVGPSSQGVPTNIGTNIGSAKPYNEDVQRKKALNTPSQKVNSKVDNFNGSNMSSLAGGSINSNETTTNSGRPHFSSISRILSSSNGRKEEVPEVLLRKVTDSPNFHPPSSPVKQSSYSPSSSFSDGSKNPNINQSKNSKDDDILSNTEAVNTVGSNNNDKSPSEQDGGVGGSNNNNRGIEQSDSDEDDFDMFVEAMNPDQDEPKTQPKIKMNTKSTEYPNNNNNNNEDGGGGSVYSTQIIHNLANINNEKSLLTTSSTPSGAVIGGSGIGNNPGSNGVNGNSKETQDNNNNIKNGVATWAVAWNIHVYLSAILFTILAVYSIFKMIFYDKLTHLFNQSYFICIHLVLIIICMTRIFYLCYDAYNIHSSFHQFVSEILLNLPATFLTISFSVLILFLLIRSLNHKNNRYSALIRPLTVVVGSSVHVGLCVTLHYVESYTTSHNSHLYYQHQQQQQQQHQMYRNGYRGSNIGGTLAGYNHQLPPPPPPRVLSLICQIIYIFVCLSLGLLYLYIYRVLKRVLRSKSQNYIHGYQNLSYAIHITIATALLFVLLAALQIYGAISISTTRPLITSSSEIDWLQWGYQFSLRLIEIAIITLMSWVAGLKTGGTSGVLQREKAADTHNVSGFALFPCTSSSSQEHFETDYPAVCNANTNLHTYTLRTGKPIYDDNFALNSLGSGSVQGGGQVVNSSGQRITSNNDFQLQNSSDFVRSYETSSLRSTSAQGAGGGGGSSGHHHHHHHHHNQNQMIDNGSSGHHSDFLTDPQTDHYENPNFELRPSKQDNLRIDNCYSEPLNSHGHHMIGAVNTAGQSAVGGGAAGGNGYDFQNFERPVFSAERPTSRNDLHASKSIKHIKSTGNHLDRSNYENPERRSSNSTHSCTSGRNYPSYNSFERRSGVRKSGTLNNIGGVMHGRNGSSSSSSSSSRPSGVQTLSSTHHNRPQVVAVNNSNNTLINSQGSGRIINTATASGKQQFYRDRNNHRSSLERSSSAAMQQYMLPSDDDIANPERANLITNGSGSGITSSTSGGNLTDACNQHNVIVGVGGGGGVGGACGGGGGAASSSSGESANSGSMLVAEHGFVRFRALDDINNAQGVGIHNASIRTTGRSKEKRYTNNT